MHALSIEDPLPALYQGALMAEVVAVDDPERRGRVQVRLLNFDGPAAQNGPIWAQVAVPFAGADRGAFLLPDVGDPVIVTFLNGDPRWPVVIGGVWHGAAAPPETLGGSRIDRWSLVGKAGTRIAIVEESAATATISFTTPGGVAQLLTDESGGKVEIRAAGATITIDSSGVSVNTPATVTLNATRVDVTAGMVNVSAGFSKFTGIVQCDTLISNAVVSSSYTPGAGNVW